MITLEQINQIALDYNLTPEGYSDKEVIEGSFTESSMTTINRLVGFIKRYLPNKNKTINKRYNSYTIKNKFEKIIGHFYITNGEFIVAMIFCGFTIKPISESINVNFNMPEKDYKAICNIVDYQ